MESKLAVAALSALAHEGRIAAFHMLVQAGHDGVAAGEMARRLGVPANTLAANLAVLSPAVLAPAGLVAARRDGRSIIYTARYDRMSRRLICLTRDCCQGRPDVCAPLADAVSRVACRPGRHDA